MIILTASDYREGILHHWCCSGCEPLVPYEIPLLIDSVSVRRTQAPRRLSGDQAARSSRAQQFITNPRHGLGGDEIGERAGSEPAVELASESRRADQVDAAFPDGGSVAQSLQMEVDQRRRIGPADDVLRVPAGAC